MKCTEMTIEQLCHELMMLRSKAPKLEPQTSEEELYRDKDS